VPYLAVAFLILLLAPASAFAQAGVTYRVPADNPFVGQSGATPEVYALGLRNPYRFSFDRLTGDILIGDVGGSQREEIDWIRAAAARGANFGWACREGKVAGPRPDECPIPNAVQPLFDYPTDSPDAVTGGFVVRDSSLTGLVGRYLYADYYTGLIRSLALNFADPDDQSTGATVSTLASFGEDASGRLYAANHLGDQVVRLTAGPTSGTLSTSAISGAFDAPVALGTYPGDANRLFVAEKGGKVRLVDDGAVLPTPYLDVAPFGLTISGERGLLSVVAAPDYESSGKTYVYYTDAGGDIHIEEFRRSLTAPDTADPTTRRIVLVIEHSASTNHNGGQMHFGVDGCLWVTTGDGGGQNNQFNNAQNVGTLLGKVLRIDPDPPGVGGATCGGTSTLPPPPPPDPTGTVDTTRPTVAARAPRRQRVLRLRGAIVYVRCSESCNLSVGGTLAIRGRRLLLRRVAATAEANERLRLRVRLRARAVGRLRRALAEGRRPTVTLRVRARDSAGNRAPLVRRTVRVRR
jgi:glucose/arabinose dehydrogenase